MTGTENLEKTNVSLAPDVDGLGRGLGAACRLARGWLGLWNSGLSSWVV